MAWIESHQELARHPKTKRLARALDVSMPAAIGHLHLLWWWSLDYAQDGDLTGFEDQEIADAALWEGDPDHFLAALIACGFVNSTDGSHTIHDWDEYAGKLIDRRRRNAEQMRAARAITKEERVVLVLDTSTTREDTCKATIPNSTQHNTTEPDQSQIAPTSSARVKKTVSTDMWDELIAVGYPEPVTKSERDRRNGGIKQLVDAGVQTTELRTLREEYIKRFPGVAVTLHGLLNHIAELRKPAVNGNGHHANGYRRPSVNDNLIRSQAIIEDIPINPEWEKEWAAQEKAEREVRRAANRGKDG